MYDKDGSFGLGVKMWVMNRLQCIIANTLYIIFLENWQHKTHMWVVGFWNLPYVKQDTNVAIESYNAYLFNSGLWKSLKIKKEFWEFKYK